MLDLRHHYFVPTHTDGSPAVEMRAFTHGLMPRSVPDMMDGFVEDWRQRGVDAWNQVPDRWQTGAAGPVGWWNLPEHLGDHFIGPLLGAPAGTCIHQPNVHWSVSALLSCDEPFEGGRNEIVCTELDFPSVLHTIQQWSGLRDIRPVILPAGADGFADVEAVLDAITERTAVVFMSHVGFTSGECLPDDELRRVADAAHASGALFFVDGYHAASTMPVDVAAIGCDAYFGGLLKEASGSTGNAYLYIRKGLDLTPRLAGWFGDADPFGFGMAPAAHPGVRRRFIGGTTAVASMYHAVEGVRLLLDAGLAEVRAHSLALTGRAIEHVDASGLPLRSPRQPARRGAMVILEVPRADQLCGWLKERGVFTDSRRKKYLRLAPFVWNTEDDVDRAFAEIADALASGAYHAWNGEQEGGPVT